MRETMMTVVAGLGVAVFAASASAQSGWPGVVCWGSNGICNVLAGLGSVRSVAVGANHTVAVKSDGSVACWSDNFNNAQRRHTALGNMSPIRYELACQKRRT